VSPRRWSDSPALPTAALRALDRRATEEFGVPALVLMEHAGAGAARALLDALAGWSLVAPKVIVLCGPGNNGGDGAVVARWLDAEGLDVRVLYACEAERLGGEAATERAILGRAGLDVRHAPPAEELARELARADLAVDALLGTGARGGAREPIASWIRALEAARRPELRVVALDVPSGFDADAGAGPGPVVRADLTITFAARKRAFEDGASARWTGPVVLVPIGAPLRAYAPDGGPRGG
jgi:NAD(P)H-hydrate epimerase